jgi:hypothetical protein
MKQISFFGIIILEAGCTLIKRRFVMKQTKKKMVWLVVFLGIGSIQASAKPFAKGPYLGQTPPGPIPKVFAPGLICNTIKHPYDTFGTFSADGNTFCFSRARGVVGVFITENTDQGWTTPKRIESLRESRLAPWSVCLSPDANSIFFTRALIKPLHKRNLYRCIRTPSGWAAPEQLGPPLSSSDKDISCSIAANNNIYLCSTRKGEDGRNPTSLIWVVPFVDTMWSRAVNITLNDAPPRPGCPGIAPDESFMVFYSIKPGAVGGTETNLYLTLRQADGTWSKSQNMGPRINSKFYEHGPRISPDKKYLFFNRSNGWDPGKPGVCSYIYWVELKEYLPESYR